MHFAIERAKTFKKKYDIDTPIGVLQEALVEEKNPIGVDKNETRQ